LLSIGPSGLRRFRILLCGNNLVGDLYQAAEVLGPVEMAHRRGRLQSETKPQRPRPVVWRIEQVLDLGWCEVTQPLFD